MEQGKAAAGADIRKGRRRGVGCVLLGHCVLVFFQRTCSARTSGGARWYGMPPVFDVAWWGFPRFPMESPPWEIQYLRRIRCHVIELPVEIVPLCAGLRTARCRWHNKAAAEPLPPPPPHTHTQKNETRLAASIAALPESSTSPCSSNTRVCRGAAVRSTGNEPVTAMIIQPYQPMQRRSVLPVWVFD